MAALRLSYNDLSPEMKLVFAYCSLFPKDYVFNENILVLLWMAWMAEGFLSKSKGNKTMESLGRFYFEQLKSRSLFQQSTNDESGYTMHNLIHDLATSVAGEFFFRLDDKTDASNPKETFEKLRHFSIIGPQWQSYRKLTEVRKTAHLRTFFPLLVGWESQALSDDVVESLPQLQFLRVISVTDLNPWAHTWEANQKITKVPKTIGSLKHLRYLNFSNTAITCLSEEVSKLYNLRSLLVSGCTKLFGLPKGIGKLKNLRHRDLSHTPKLVKMPLGIGGLTSLQTLPKVIIAGADGFKLSELKDLSDIQGQLSVTGKVMDPVQAKHANLHQKKGLEILQMEWSSVIDDSRSETIKYQVLEQLRPHPNLRDLRILFYQGTRFPNWVGDPSFDQLTKLTLFGCKSTQLPRLGSLQSLKTLFLKDMKEVKNVGFELLASTISFHDIAFPSLEVLKIDNMQEWERWSTSGGDDNGAATSFPRLRKISIERCSKLGQVSIGLIPSLQVLRIHECSEEVLRSMVGVSSSPVKLKMREVEGLTQLDGEYLTHLGAVEDLRIDRCDILRYLWAHESVASKFLVSLQKLEVSCCKNLVSIGEKDVSLGISMESLREVKFSFCETLGSYNCPNSVERLEVLCCDSMTSLTFSTLTLTKLKTPFCLRSLQIRGFQNLESFPEQVQSLVSLEEMVIWDCPSMDYSFPCGLWPPNLRKLDIGGLKKPMSKWGQQNYPTSLVHLHLYGKNSGVVSFAVAEDGRNTTASASSSFLLPPSLASLTLYVFEDVESLSEVLKHLPRLKGIGIFQCPKLDVTSIPSSLTVVEVIP